jgi:hypothetical protein
MKLLYRWEYGFGLGSALGVLVLGRYLGVLPALVFIVAVEAMLWYGSKRSLAVAGESSSRVLALSTAAVFISQSVSTSLQIVFAVVLLLWLIWLATTPRKQHYEVATAAITQASVLTALFLSSSLPGWRWPSWLVMVLLWPSSWLVAWRLLTRLEERLAAVLSAAWALIVVEVSWVLLLWQVSYGLPGGVILVPQATVVILSLGYCFMGIYLSHRRSQLSRGRLVEYAAIGLGLLLLVLAGTRWSGSI